jgi:hypothetical protein
MQIKRRDLTAFYISYQDATIKLMTNIAKNFNINVEELFLGGSRYTYTFLIIDMLMINYVNLV